MSFALPSTDLELSSPLARMMMYSLDFLGFDNLSIFLVLWSYGYSGEEEPVEQAVKNNFKDFRNLEPYHVTRSEQQDGIVFECDKLPQAQADQKKSVIIENGSGRTVKIRAMKGQLWCLLEDQPVRKRARDSGIEASRTKLTGWAGLAESG